MQLADFIGQTISMSIPRIHPVIWQQVKLHGVEAGGVWIESQAITNAVLQHAGVPAAPKTLVAFLPYHEIAFAISAIAEPSLDEKAFGL